ncbi:glutathione S-transferase-like [Ornithodoros turicata]|uniref:glutathione S-transferase-like n=1 Tax=Ornithodoros turicata TaxID=34597 RepID=UPI00313948CB
MVPVLGYWDLRGLAQPIRYLLAHAGVEYEDKRYSNGSAPNWNRDEWLAEKYNLGLDFPNLPYYVDGDVKLTQSLAILKYLGRKHGLAPETAEEQRRVDVAEMQAFDLTMSNIRLCYDSEYNDEKRKVFLEAFQEKADQFSRFLADHAFIAGDRVTYADFLLYEALEGIRALDPGVLKNHPILQRYVERVAAGFKEYLQSPRFKSWPIWSYSAQDLGPQHTRRE